MAFNNIGKMGIDKSDMVRWATSKEAKAFVEEVGIYRGQAFKALLKDGEKGHSKNAESYKVWEKVVSLLNEAGKL